ncbi:hypothetical protein K456DRAFT_115691 [Colletotrichum gloeosporioides 23]|nr:hypothetical protein K456DRAFT_115691 [Colletotrichum gloeosporioides 23]
MGIKETNHCRRRTLQETQCKERSTASHHMQHATCTACCVMRTPLPLIRPPSTPASLASPRLILTTPHPHHLKVLWHKVPPYAVNYHTTTPSPMVGWTVGQRPLLLQEEKSSASSSTPPRSWPHQVAMPCPYQMQPLAQPRRHRHRHRGQATPHYRRRPSVGTQYLIVLTTRRDEDDVRKDSASTLRLSHPDRTLRRTNAWESTQRHP